MIGVVNGSFDDTTTGRTSSCVRSHCPEFITSRRFPFSVLEELKKSAERSQLRQLRRLQQVRAYVRLSLCHAHRSRGNVSQLQKQAEYARQRDDMWKQKDEQSRERERRKQLEREESMRDRARRR